MQKKQNIIFLYAELTPYFVGCLNFFFNSYTNFNILVVYDDKFRTVITDNIRFNLKEKNDFKTKKELLEYCKKFQPSLILISGRMFKDYLFVARKFKGICKTVTVQDTVYSKTFKQFIIRLFSQVLYRRYFDYFWGVGELQEKFALSIGYKKENTFKGFYVADKIFFKANKKNNFNPKNMNFLFIGRLVKEKNILRLVKIIKSINKRDKSSHYITIIGDGYLRSDILKYSCVRYEGLLPQNQIIKFALNSDVFILPSLYEPWGVVTHEMSALGLPLLLSEKCGSSFNLVENGVNGFTFNPKSNNSIISAIDSFFSLSLKEKKEFSLNSIIKSKSISHESWNNTLIELTNRT